MTDTGIGIRKEVMDSLFTRFSRADDVQKKHIEGTGLGLAIVKQLVDLMGGEINVESVYGEGSDFSFTVEQKVVDWEPMGDYEQIWEELAPDLQVLSGLLRQTSCHDCDYGSEKNG